MVVDGTAPTASLTYPATGQPLSGAVGVTGTASNSHVSSYVLEYGAGTAPTTWTAIAGSTYSVTGGTLAGWATEPLTGVQTVRLTVTDFAGNTAAATATVYLDNTGRGGDAYRTRVPFDLGGGWSLSVNVSTGEASLYRGLFAIPSYGPPQSLSLAYNSADTGTGGQFGTGWSSNLTQYLSFELGFVVWHRADGGRVPFGQLGGSWTALAGHYEQLSSGLGTCGQELSTCVIKLHDQTLLVFEGSGAGRLLSINDRFGKALQLDWGSSGATATDASGRATSIDIDSANHRITAVTDSAGRHWGFAYSGANLTGITDPAGKVTTLAYDGSNQLTGVSRQRTPYGGSAATIAWTIGYTDGRVTSVTDPIGGATTPVTSSLFTYGYGTTTVRILADATLPAAPVYNTSNFLWDSHGWVTWSTDANGWASTASYDGYGNVTSSSRQVSASTWATTNAAYDSSGNVTSTTNPLGAVTAYTYNANNDVLTVTTASGQAYALKTAYVYDAAGHLCRTVVKPTVDPATLGCSGTLEGNADQNIDTHYEYDSNNQLASQTDPLGIVTTYGHDAYGNLTSVTRNYVAGQADNSTSVTTTYAYDQGTTAGKAGLPKSRTEPISTSPARSRTTEYTYDVMGRVLTETVQGDATVPSQKTVNTYDELGNVVHSTVYSPSEAASALSSATTTFDARNRATVQTSVSQTASTTTTTTYDVVATPSS